MKDIHHYKNFLYGRLLNLDLLEIQKSCKFLEKVIHRKFLSENYSVEFSVKTTNLFKNYNLFMYPLPGFHELYCEIKKTFNNCLNESGLERQDPYFMQCWINVIYKNQFIDWHDHWDKDKNAWHGFFCVDVEPESHTSYTWDNFKNVLDIKSKNNLLVLGHSGSDKHKTSDWNFDKPRITIAFDIVPQKSLIEVFGYGQYGFDQNYVDSYCSHADCINHWIPI